MPLFLVLYGRVRNSDGGSCDHCGLSVPSRKNRNYPTISRLREICGHESTIYHQNKAVPRDRLV